MKKLFLKAQEKGREAPKSIVWYLFHKTPTPFMKSCFFPNFCKQTTKCQVWCDSSYPGQWVNHSFSSRICRGCLRSQRQKHLVFLCSLKTWISLFSWRSKVKRGGGRNIQSFTGLPPLLTHRCRPFFTRFFTTLIDWIQFVHVCKGWAGTQSPFF